MQKKISTQTLNFSLLCLSACICQSLYAETETSSNVVLPTLKIEATRTDTSWLNTPASVYRVEQNKNQNNLGVNLTETLKGVPGLQLNNRENYAQDLQISMRGFGARSTFGVRGIRLYVDGIPATMPDGQGQTSNIDLSSLDHIEVLGGPFSSLYGNSSGGTVLTTTKQGEGRDSIELGYSTGSHNKNRGDIILQGGSDKAGEPSYVVSTSYFDTDGYRDHSEANKTLSNAKLTWDLNDGSKINWMINHVDITANDPGGLNYSDWKKDPKQVVANVTKYNARKDIKQTQTGVNWTKPLNEKNEIYVMGYAGQREVTQFQSTPEMSQIKDPINEQKKPYQAGGVIDFDRSYYGLDLRWTGKDLLPNTRFSAGLAFDYMDEDRQGYNNFTATENGVKGELRRNERNTLWDLDPYLQASWNFLPSWTLDAGLRYSNVHYKTKDFYVVGKNLDNSGKTDYDKFLPSAALSWKITDSLSAYASYAKGFETPTFTEMAYSPAGESQDNNLDLNPSESDNYEIGVKSQNVLGNFTASAFESKTKNDIVSAGSIDGRSTFRNADKTLRQGFEFSWDKNLWRDLTAQLTYSFIDATFDANIPAENGVDEVKKGTFIPGIAKNQAYFALGWLPETGFNAGIDMRYMDKIYVKDNHSTNQDIAPDYILVSANIGYIWKNDDWKVRTYARVDNLFDENYVGSVIVNESNSRYFEPADGINWSAGLSVTKAF
ncbi:TonB-dependent receptor family protein [Acinetobacter lanii]|uniref:TonB-dependent receptor n=1 Tax=Acinetobacter lanii TaxID=2715163 RepID=A0A6G8S1I1_9GAMM|nr:TonB-dependent receptor [Acinetobacter lanii]QIO08066.1 TonB-dependent receptor [Acinetobacter lanii]